MIPTTIQMSRAAQLTDATFNSIAEVLRGAEPGLSFLPTTPFGFVAGLRQAHPSYPQHPCVLLILGRVNAPIAADVPGWFAQHLLVMLKTGQEELDFVWIANQEAILRNQSAVHFARPQLAAKLGLFRFSFAPTNDGRVRLKQAHHLVRRGDGVQDLSDWGFEPV